jgi:hypothetical protein
MDNHPHAYDLEPLDLRDIQKKRLFQSKTAEKSNLDNSPSSSEPYNSLLMKLFI